jgi:hypothetical protein
MPAASVFNTFHLPLLLHSKVPKFRAVTSFHSAADSEAIAIRGLMLSDLRGSSSGMIAGWGFSG